MRYGQRKEVILRTFARFRVFAHFIEIGLIDESVDPAGNHFVREILMLHIQHELVYRRVKHVMKSDDGFHVAEVRTYMARIERCAVEDSLTHLVGHLLQFLNRHTFDVGGTLDVFYLIKIEFHIT